MQKFSLEKYSNKEIWTDMHASCFEGKENNIKVLPVFQTFILSEL